MIPRGAVAAEQGPATCPALLQHTFNNLQTGAPPSLCQHAGKVVVIVNTASYCDFGAQEPGTNKEVAEFFRLAYGVQFPMFEKSSVARLDTQPLYAELVARTGHAPRWNFHKYVVDRNRSSVVSFESRITPDSREFVSLIEKLLAEKPAAGKS